MADPGFPRGGGTNPKGGVPTYYLANFCQKLHENEENLGQTGGGHASLVPPLRSATADVDANDASELVFFYSLTLLKLWRFSLHSLSALSCGILFSTACLAVFMVASSFFAEGKSVPIVF